MTGLVCSLRIAARWVTDYNEYRAYCLRTGEYARSTTDFYQALDLAGFEKKKTKTGVIIQGVQLKNGEFIED